MGNAKSRKRNSSKIKTEISGISVESLDITKTAAREIFVQEDDKVNVGGTTKTVTPTATSAGGPLLVEVKNISLETTTTSNSNKEIKGPQQTQQQYKLNQRQQKAADNSVALAAADQQRLKQASSFWSLGSLNWNLSYSGRRNSYKQRQKSAYSTLQYQRKRSKTQWHKPLTNAIFSSHFKEASRNEEFHIEQLVAKGAFGVVFKVIDKKSLSNDDNEKLQQQHPKQQQCKHKPQQPSECSQVITAAKTLNDHPSVYALKVLKKSKIISENSLQQIKDEVDIQKLCGHHPFIVKQFDLWQNRYNLHILSEYIPNGELFNSIRTFSLNLIRLYLAEIALALDFLHNAGIIYRDAKPENILLTSNYHLKLTDFGLSKWLKLGLTTRTMCGTFQYMAPEILRGEPYTHAVDWWSLGIIVCQMFVQRSPDVRKFINLNLPQHLQTQVAAPNDKSFRLHVADSTKLFPDAENFLPPEVEGLCHEAKDVLKRLLEFDAQQRLRSVRALQRIAMFRDFKIEAKNCLRAKCLEVLGIIAVKEFLCISPTLFIINVQKDMAAVEHTFQGTWEIVSCTFEGKKEISGLEGIKFRLDDTSDITWYNDLVSPLPETKDCVTCCDSASVLFSCETFEVNENNPRLIFGAFAGHSIEFNTSTLTPADTLILYCENWYAVECKRLKEDQAAGQEKEFSFAEALNESYFSDVIIKSSDGFEYHVHASILRLNGFDCSMCVHATSTISLPQACTSKCKENASLPNSPNPIKIAVTMTGTNNLNSNTGTSNKTLKQETLEEQQKSLPRLNLSPIYLQPPANGCQGNATMPLRNHQHTQLSSSFNCLTTKSQMNVNQENVCGMRRFPPNSHSDSHLETHNLQPQTKNIFNFCQDLMLQHTTDICTNTTACNARRPPLSPYRARSPSPFPSSMDTPPSSPLTPVGVLYDLPAFLLTPILHWLYTESLMADMSEDVCEKLINFAETQPSLMKLAEPAKKYLNMIKLKKFVVNIIMDLHSILNRVIQTINPVTISHEPALLYATFKDSLRECSIGCAKILQFCNIFIKDAADIARHQKNEIIKYVRTRIPIFMSQLHQLLRNILNVFLSLTPDEKDELANYLVPEIETTLLTLASVIEEIKNSLEKMCKDLKCSHLDLSLKYATDDAVAMQIQNNTFITASNAMSENTVSTLFSQPPLSPRPRRGPPIGLTFYDNPSDKQRLMGAENDLKFVLYMYEVRKMRDIYGRISAALDIIRDKKTTYCDMDFLSKRSTINQNLEQLIVDIPSYILIMENLSDRLEEKLGWKEFKFCFKLATSQINGVIVKIFDHKFALKDAMSQICKLVQKQEFTQTLIDLGLLEPSNILESELKILQKDDPFKLSLDPLVMERQHNYDYKNVKLNLIRHLCEPPIAVNSNLSKNALRLLHSAQLADMEFEVHILNNPTFANNSQGNTMKKNTLDIQSMEALKTPIQVHTFRAHRVIVAARCEWFKKALMSGMQESLTRKIIINDTSPVIFRRLLLYLYGAPIDKTVGAEQICELMLLADKYSIEDLKELCETTLNSQIDDHSVLCLLAIADHYMASALKSKCLSFLSQNSHLTKAAMFKELSRPLQLEVMDLIHWYGRVAEPWTDSGGFKPRSTSRHSLKSPSKPRSRSRKSSPSFM